MDNPQMVRMNCLNNAVKMAELQLSTKQLEKVSIEIIEAIAKRFERYIQGGAQ